MHIKNYKKWQCRGGPRVRPRPAKAYPIMGNRLNTIDNNIRNVFVKRADTRPAPTGNLIIQEKAMKKIFINTILIGLILGILMGILVIRIGDNRIKEKDYNTSKIKTLEEINNINNEVTVNESQKQYPKEEIITTYKGYKVCAKLEIPSIPLKAYILNDYSKKALKASCTKFWGVEPNTNGNICIAGHNTKSMFSGVKYLELGDTLYITDNNIGKVEYEVFSINKVIPKNVDCLDAVTKGEKEVTLITCTNDSTKRVIVKAKEKM